MREETVSLDTLVRRYSWSLFARVIAANYLMIATLAVYVWLLVPVFTPETPSGPLLFKTLIPGLPLITAVSVHGLLFVRLKWQRASRWLAERRAPTPDELDALYAMPRQFATIPLWYWLVTMVVMFPYYFYVLDYRPGPLPYAKTVVAFAFLAFIGWALSHLLVERALRPVMARAMSAEPTRTPRTMSLVLRLVIAWAATSGVPVAGIAVTILGLSGAETARARAAFFAVCLVSLVTGAVIAAFAGSVIAEPIRVVRAAMHSIERGDLDVDVPVTDTAELGDLEVGFNRMASGLRERERMRDIFGRHVGTDVAKRALERDDLGGERCEASAMFIDVIGSTSLAQQRDPDEVVGVLNAFFDAVVRTVAAEGGYVNKFEGDGAMCIFGAPMNQPDHAARALRAAQALSIELANFRGDIGAAIGISSGPVVAGNIGAVDRYEYTVIGDPVNEASRLCDAAKEVPSRVLVSSSTMTLAGDVSDGWCEAGTFTLRGRAQETIAYSLT